MGRKTLARLRPQTAWGDMFPELTESRARVRRRKLATQVVMLFLALGVAALAMAAIQLIAAAHDWLRELLTPQLPVVLRTIEAASQLLA